MKLRTKIAAVLAALALAAVPATVAATPPAGHGPEYNPAPEKPETPGPSAGMPEKAKAYGVYCKDQSKKHVDGQKGTPFGQCVNAMAKAANNEKLSPGKACKGMSKKHVKGQKGTAFSRCVDGVAKLRKEHQQV
jgi:invasion protein IalB